jgi:hypothetical protein
MKIIFRLTDAWDPDIPDGPKEFPHMAEPLQEIPTAVRTSLSSDK